MKKLLVTVLLVAMLMPTFAMAESTFALRNGYTWGMSVEEAKALAAAEGLILIFDEEVGDIDHCLGFEGVAVGDNVAYFALMFYPLPGGGHALGNMIYRFGEVMAGSPEEEALQDYLQSCLTVKYGMGTVPTLRGRNAFLCWPLGDTFIELIHPIESGLGAEGEVEYVIKYSASIYVKEPNDPFEEPLNSYGF